MKDEKRFTEWCEKFDELALCEQLSIYNEYCREVQNEDEIYDFDDYFFEEYFSKPADAVRAWHFGGKRLSDGSLGDNSWSDEYIKFNGYANLETLSEYDVEEQIKGYLSDIFNHEDIWEDYITLDDEEDDFDEE